MPQRDWSPYSRFNVGFPTCVKHASDQAESEPLGRHAAPSRSTRQDAQGHSIRNGPNQGTPGRGHSMKATIGITLTLLTLIVGVALATPLELRSPIEWSSVAADADATTELELPTPVVTDQPSRPAFDQHRIARRHLPAGPGHALGICSQHRRRVAGERSKCRYAQHRSQRRRRCCSARLTQKVLRKLALGRRMEDAYAAAQRYDQLVASMEAAPGH